MSRKIKKWEEIPEETRNKLTELREKEKEYIEKSGYHVWKKFFIGGFAIYASLVLIYLKNRQYSDVNLFKMIKIMLPMLPYGIFLKSMYFNLDFYKEYYKIHSQINKELYVLKTKRI